MNKMSSYVMNWRNRLKKKLIEYKGGKCSRCGYDKIEYLCVFDFHHEGKRKKEFTIAEAIRNCKKREDIINEVDKCLLLCSNCHREVHADLVSEKTKLRMKIKFRAIPEKICPGCNKKFKPNNKRIKYCSKKCCLFKGNGLPRNHKVEWPEKEELKKMIESMSWCAIGRKYGVSDNAVRKWARKYSLI